MFSFFKDRNVTFATSCFERDWQKILEGDRYLKENQIGNHQFPFAKKILIINNVNDYEIVINAAKKRVEEGILDEFFVAKDYAEEILNFFQLKRESFKADGVMCQSDDWVYYNALPPLAAIYFCKSPYLLYQTGDVFLEERVQWIDKALDRLKGRCRVANLLWNRASGEAKREAVREERDFFVAKKGFSDQLFLVRTKDFRKPIYGEIRDDASHFPRGDVFEKRVYSYMINHGWRRVTYKHGSYTHL